jgi:hypothetical protein
VSTADRRLLARETALSTVVAASLAAVLLWAAPPGIDWAAHAYQTTFLIQHGFAIWNNFWYAGRYSFVTYSLIYYPLAAVLGIKVLALASVATAAAAFTFVVMTQWGPATRISSRTFAVLWAGIVGSAAFPFALAISFALLALSALQQGRRARFALCAVLTLTASPLAFVLLVVVAGGAALSRRSLRNAKAPLAALAVCAAAELVIYRLFGDGGRFPFATIQLLPALIFCGLGLFATRDVAAAKPLRGLFALYLLAVVAAYVVPSSVGSNIERMRYAALPLALIVVALRKWRPLWLVVPALVLAAVWNLTPIASSLAQARSDPETKLAYWQPAITYLHGHLSPSYRVEVVDTAEHWPAAYFPDAGIPIVRGWYRQSDFPQNELLYDGKLGAPSYDAWLRALGVRYVVLTDAPTDYSSRLEAQLVRSGTTSLVPVFSTRHLTIYELPHATPLITGAGGASVLWLYPSRLVAVVSSEGWYDVRVRWAPYWQASDGCIARAHDGMVRLFARHAGLIELRFQLNVGRGLQALAGTVGSTRCTR